MKNKNVVIVESPNKIAKIQSFLKDTDRDTWKVISSVGHIKDLATWGTPLRLGIDLDTMEPKYIELKEKKEVIEEIANETSDANNIFLATDPDREGEAIAFHILNVIKNKDAKIYRITFNEITKESVLDSIQNGKGSLNEDLVSSQESRRILDRMIGFRLSFLTNKKISARSAGRVKSAVLKLIIDRENQIEKFKPDFWWTIEAQLNKKKSDEKLVNVTKDKFTKIKYEKENEAKTIFKKLTGDLEFVQRKKSSKKVSPPLPLEMSSYLVAMYSNHNTPNMSANIAAQSLYEKGLISYPRTDSKRISSKDFIDATTKYINENFGKDTFKGIPIVKNSSKSQDAHEAIRPVDITKTPSSLKGLKLNEKRAYQIIWSTTVKSFMVEGKNIIFNDIYKDNDVYFTYKTSFPEIPGFRVVDGVEPYKDDGEKPKSLKIDKEKLELKENKTKPPARFNSASVVKTMKEVGIGRPSTYSGVVSGLIGYGYLENNGGQFIPTEMAREVNDLLQGNFKDIINEKYTAKMESSLDEISLGNIDGKKYLSDFWKDFSVRVEEADKKIKKKPPVFVGRDCPKCDEGKLIIKRGRFGQFISCDKFPDCSHTEPLVPKPEPLDTKIICPKCNKNNLVVRESTKRKNKFIGCSGFPKCDLILPGDESAEVLFNLKQITEEEKNKRIENWKKRQELNNKKEQ